MVVNCVHKNTNFVHKNTIRQAFRLGEHSEPSWFIDAVSSGEVTKGEKKGKLFVRLATPTGDLDVFDGAWIINGRFYIYNVSDNQFREYFDVVNQRRW